MASVEDDVVVARAMSFPARKAVNSRRGDLGGHDPEVLGDVGEGP